MISAVLPRIAKHMVAQHDYGPYLPIRSHVGNRKVGNYWEAFSLKANRVVSFDSDLEYYFWILLESDPSVSVLCEQPLRVAARVNGKWVTSIPDIWYRTKVGGEVFCEVKYSSEIQSARPGSRVSLQLLAQLAWATQEGIRYCIASEKTVLRDPQLISNWAYLLRFLDVNRRGVNRDLGQRMIRAIAAHQQLPLLELETMFASEGSEVVRASLFYELHSGSLAAPDLRRRRLTRETIFTPRT